jgi:hypothetical protein
MRKIIPQYLLILFTILSVSISCMKQNESFILNETFDINTRGWVQEDTEFHKLEIKDGFYYIQSIDSTLDRTSSRSLDKSFLFNLPESYQVSSSIEILQSNIDNPFCGLILESPSFEYEIRVYENGTVEMERYNFFSDELIKYENIKKVEAESDLKKIELELKIDGWNFELVVNNQLLGKGKLLSKSWERIGPFAGKFTEIKIDNLSIK